MALVALLMASVDGRREERRLGERVWERIGEGALRGLKYNTVCVCGWDLLFLG